jgi:uncharacterized phage protein gp47/JayE
MTIPTLTITELQERIYNKIILSVNAGQPDSSKHIDPNIRNSAIGGIGAGMAAGFDENNDVLLEIFKQLFPQTATGEYLEIWASFFGITRNSAVKAFGNIVFTGVATTTVPLGTLIQKADDTQFETQIEAPVAASSISVSGITRSGSVATVTTASEHGLATGVSVTISGADQTDYNITAIITVTGLSTFTYAVSGTPTTPATGTILCSFTAVSIQVLASDFGVAGNSAGGSQLTLVVPVEDVDDICYVDYSGLVNGLDIEEDEDLRIRLLERTASFTAPYTEGGLPVFIKEMVPGVTRIWVQPATPDPGKTTIYFTRDNEADIFPNAAQVAEVKDAIIDPVTGIMPANTPASFVLVVSPTPVPTDFTFSTLSPNTLDMQSAITNTLTDYFKSKAVAVETTITEEEYNALIFSVLDSAGNNPSPSLTSLSSPSGDIVIGAGQLASIGNISYP